MKNLTKELQKQFDKMCQTGKLFESSVSGREVWDMYLDSFPKEENPIFRDPASSTHNCNHCKNFIRRYGNIISVNENGKLESIFSNVITTDEYEKSITACDNLLVNSTIKDVFFETYEELNSLPYESCNKTQKNYLLGVPKNTKRYTKDEALLYGVVKPNEIRTFNHFNLNIPTQFVDNSGKSIESIMAHYRDKYSVFKRAMEEISIDTLNLVKDLINQGSLLDGNTHLHTIESIAPFATKKKISGLTDNDYWVLSYDMEDRIAKFRNTLVGVLCTELAEGKELNASCKSWNKRVDPANYHKATAPITQKQIAEAQKFVEENGYEDSFNRRLATIDDIKVSEILHSNVGDGKVKTVSIFDNVKSTQTRHKRAEFDKLETVSIEKFMKDILPSCTSIEAYLENRMKGNLAVLTKAVNDDSKKIFKWDNNYSWTFNGNLAGKSQIKENVKSVGGNVDGIVRCSLQWNDKETPGIVDFDLHSNGINHIYHANNGKTHSCGGKLDTDMIRPSGIGIENIFWKHNIQDGTYNFSVKNYCGGKNAGFKIEIDMNGDVFHYSKSGNVQGVTDVAAITVKDGKFTIKHKLPETNSSKKYWNLETNNFHKVNLLCLTPNHWGDNNFGNKHYMFMLDKCKSDTQIRSFHNENLNVELLKHRKVMEVLGTTNMIEPTNNHLAGIGFNSTVKDELIVKVQGSFKRMIKIKF